MSDITTIIKNVVDEAANSGIDLEDLLACLKESTSGQPIVRDDDDVDYDDDDIPEGVPESKQGDLDLSGLTLGPTEAQQAQEELEKADLDYFGIPFNNDNNKDNNDDYDDLLSFGKTAFGRKILSKATESVRQIAKKKGIYIVGRKGKKFLGIRFTPKGNYSKNKKGRPNGKMYTYDGLKKMKKKRVSFKKLPELIDMMNTGAVLKKYKDFKFGFELRKSRCSGFGYTFPVGAGYGKRSALLYGKL